VIQGQNTLGIGRRRFHAYPQYKDSGIGWLGKVPASWQICATKRRFDIFLGKMLQPEPTSANDLRVPYLKATNIQWESVSLSSLPTMWASEHEIQTDQVAVGDLLVCEGGEVGRAAILSQIPEEPTIIQNALHRVRSQSEMLRFLMYLLEVSASRGWLDVECNKATIQHFTRDKFASLGIALPSHEEQRRIVSFLDRETAQIDALIKKNERFMELLQEKRTALITHAVTKGLDPTVSMKNSGVEWLGAIPAHWAIESNKRLFVNSDLRSDYGDEELLTVSHLSGVTRHSEKNVTMTDPESYEDYKICRAGELAINTMWAWMGALGIARENGIVSPSYNVYALTTNSIHPRYYDYLCRTPLYVAELTRYSKGVWKSRLRLYPDGFFEISTPLPPMKEQKLIVEQLDKSAHEIDSLLVTIRRALGYLREYRTALISATVTGKIDVQYGIT